MSLIDDIQNANEKFNMKNGVGGYQSKVLTTKDIPQTVALYKNIYAILKQHGCEKFIHPMSKDAIEEIIASQDQAILGYFKGKQLMGTLYTKPFEQNSPYFRTPTYDQGKTSYTLGGLAVSPEFRGQGVITKLSKIIHGGVKSYAENNPEAGISGIGAEISCENFSSLSSAKILTDENGKNMLNYVGTHHVPDGKDNDLTVLGYHSFNHTPTQLDSLPTATLNGNQQDSLSALQTLTSNLASQTSGSTTTNIDGHEITTLNEYVMAPYADVLKYNKDESPAQENEEPEQ